MYLKNKKNFKNKITKEINLFIKLSGHSDNRFKDL